MRNICLLCYLLNFAPGWAQTSLSVSSNPCPDPNNVAGFVSFLPILSVKSEVLAPNAISFNSAADYNSSMGKLFSNYIKLSVVSTIPWTISVRSLSADFTSLSTSGASVPVSIMSLTAHNTTKTFQPITTKTSMQTLLYSTNTSITTIHYVDVTVNPGWKYKGGYYTAVLQFTISPQ